MKTWGISTNRKTVTGASHCLHGFVDGETIEPLKTVLKESAVQLIALAIGNDADIATLQGLAAISGGRALPVNESAELPRFMRQELETKQQSWNKPILWPLSIIIFLLIVVIIPVLIRYWIKEHRPPTLLDNNKE